MKEQEFIFDSSKQKIFFTSDTHFWHINIIKYCNRPFETIIEKWNSRISKLNKETHYGGFLFLSPMKFLYMMIKINKDGKRQIN